MSFTLVNTRNDLSYLNRELILRPLLALDTEFRRTNKDNMQLSLLQVNDSEEIYVIDCLRIKEPEEHCNFLYSKKVKKIFHSCKEDLDAISSWCSLQMVNIFDTQLAHSFLGGSYSISYKALVNQKFGLLLDKKETRTNWLKRPLTDAQLDYAASDVEFLLEIYRLQAEELSGSKKNDWLEEEIESILLIHHLDKPGLLKEKPRYNLSKEQFSHLLKKFNEIVLTISKKEKINPTLFFSKQNQKDFLNLVFHLGLDDACNQKITPWRKELIYQSLSDLVKDKT